MTRTMYDAVTPSNIPSGVQMVAGYINGLYAWPMDAWKRFSTTPHATIDVNGSNSYADVLDVEAGDASITTAVRWTQEKHSRPLIYPPVIYCNRSNRNALEGAMASAGFRKTIDYKLWVATLDGTRTLSDMTGVTAIQYEDVANRYDLSIVYDDNWNPGLPPKPNPPTTGTVIWYKDGIKNERYVHSTDNGATWR